MGLVIAGALHGPAPNAAALKACDAIQVLIDSGQLDTAEAALAAVEDGCPVDLARQIDGARGDAAEALSAADRQLAAANSDKTIDDSERAQLINAYAAVLAIDDSVTEARMKRDELTSPSPATTTTTTTTVAIADQIVALHDLGLDEQAKDLAGSAASSGQLIGDAAEALDEPSLWERTWTSLRDNLVIVLAAVLSALAVALTAWVVLGGGKWARDRFRENRGYRLVVSDASTDNGPAFSAALRARLSTLSPWSGARVGSVLTTVDDLPSFADLGDHFKLVDWFLKKTMHRRWITLSTSLLPSTQRGASAVLELSGATSRKTIVRTAPPGPVAEKDLAMHLLVPPAAAWLVWNWKPNTLSAGEARQSVGTNSWRSLAHNLAGVEHLSSLDLVDAHSCFVHAVADDVENVLARHNLLVTTAALAPSDVDITITVLDGFDELILALEQT